MKDNGVEDVLVTTSVSFKAGVDEYDDVYGNLQQTENGPGRDLDRKFHGANLCYWSDPINYPGTAVFGGVFDSSTDPSLVGELYLVEVFDGGEGKKALGPDQYGIYILGKKDHGDRECIVVEVDLYNLVRGNIQVHYGDK